MNCKQLKEVADDLFKKKGSLNSLHQELALNFYVERADFTTSFSLGDEFASHLMSSYPLRVRRDMGNQVGTMLRPTAKEWFHLGIRYNEKVDNETKSYLEWFGETQRRAMYDPKAQLARATKTADHDFVTFGNASISVELNKQGDGILYRCWHLRDMAWQEDEEGQIGAKFRKWKTTAQTGARVFKNASEKLKQKAEKTPFEEVTFLHMVVDAEMYDSDARGRPRFSIWYDCDHDTELEAVPIWGRYYIIPRWNAFASQYGSSPAAVCALPDARLLQAMTFTLLEAGEKATTPPMIATQGVVRGDLALYAGGVTWVDQDYDEKLGAALRPLEQDLAGMQYGLQMNADTRLMIHDAFYLNALTLPQRAPEMTAYEVGQRVQEYIRNALPLFEPMEDEYNSALCDETFDLMWRNGAFGSPDSWPRQLRGAEIAFTFESPLHDAIEQMKVHKFQTAGQLIAAAVALDPSTASLPKAEVMLRESLTSAGCPATWVNSEAYVADAKRQQEAQAQQQQLLANLQAGSEVVKNVGSVAPATAA